MSWYIHVVLLNVYFNIRKHIVICCVAVNFLISLISQLPNFYALMHVYCVVLYVSHFLLFNAENFFVSLKNSFI